MPRGLLGADSNDLVNAMLAGVSLLDRARQHLGGEAKYWGRYFKGPNHPNHEQYQPHTENRHLHDRGIRVLPVARQTRQVGGSEADGRNDAERNVRAVLWAFGAEWLAGHGGAFQYYLDVEPTHPMSRAYYSGWAREIEERSHALTGGTVRLEPCVYLNGRDRTTQRALREAVDDDAVTCGGLWVARYFNFDHTGCHAVTDWGALSADPVEPVPAPVRIWQFIGDCFQNIGNFHPLDFNQLNPDNQQETLRLLIPPPAS